MRVHSIEFVHNYAYIYRPILIKNAPRPSWAYFTVILPCTWEKFTL